MVGIYLIHNNINNKVYVGQSIHIQTRIKEHFWKAENVVDISYNSALHSAIRKYGKDNFSWRVLEECTAEQLDDREKHYIQLYDSIAPNGYNILSDGQLTRSEPNYCSLCKSPISKSATLCLTCYHKFLQRCERPNREVLKSLIRTTPFIQIGKQFNVSDNAIRKWCLNYDLPTTKKIIQSYSDEEWEKI